MGLFRQGGREWQPKKRAEGVRVYDFIDDAEGKAIPYGVYDMGDNSGWVNVGVDHDTPAFAVASIRAWWRRMGRRRYPNARELLVTADAGGSNSYRSRLWKMELQRLASDTGLVISVCHFPPGTSKWNKIEHQMFCHIAESWRGCPLCQRE
ncbi:ISAzo13 family transposase [Corallococcus exiguus]|nr:ISAzo13 family transposase [Corallococcus exiguus]